MEDKFGVVFDFDGTLTLKEKSIFRAIEEDEAALPKEGRDAQIELRDHYLPIANIGKMTKEDDELWLKLSVGNLIKYGLTRQGASQALKQVRLRQGVFECLEMLKAASVPVAVISYGVATLIELFLEENGLVVPGHIQKVYGAVLTCCPDTGKYLDYNPKSLVYQATKGTCSRHFAGLNGIPFKNIFAVGDSGGDKNLGYRKKNRLAIAKNDAQACHLRPLMGEVVITESFYPVTQWLKSKLKLV